MTEESHMERIPTFEYVLYDVQDGVATITMNRPDQLNALSKGMFDDVTTAMRAADDDDAVRCIILTGTGRAFTSGADVSGGDPAGGHIATPVTAWDWHNYFFLRQRNDNVLGGMSARNVSKPVIAAVNGLCYAAGLITIAQCDIVIASHEAKFCMIEARVGQSGGANLPFLVGPQWAKILMLTGEVITARQAQRIGLVALAVPHETLMERARAFAKRIAALPRYGVMLNKAHIDGTLDMMGWRANDRFSQSQEAIIETMAMDAETPDGRRLWDISRNEGFRAFKNARDEAFTENLLTDDDL